MNLNKRGILNRLNVHPGSTFTQITVQVIDPPILNSELHGMLTTRIICIVRMQASFAIKRICLETCPG